MLDASWGQAGKGPRSHAREFRCGLVSYSESLNFSEL